MQVIELAQIPNLSFTITLEGIRWDVRIKQAVNSMIMDLSADGVVIVSGARLVAGSPVIPYAYLQGDGNFMVLTELDEIPNWERFSIDQLLVYATFDEISASPREVVRWPKKTAYQSSQPIINNLIIVLEPS